MTAAGSRLLVIDDDAIVRDSIVAYLEDSGFEIVEAANGVEGLELFEQSEPDLVLCDLRMPKMDGLTMLRTLRQHARKTPFIVVSGAGVMNDVVEALRLGASDYIVKPIVDLEVLEHSINRALASARLERENSQYRESLEKAIAELEESLEELRADHKAGRQVQKKMLPPTPFSVGEYELHHHIWPSLYLSGDFADYFRVGEHRFAFYLADVSGHGASSAFVTVLLKHMSMELRRDYLRRTRLRLRPSDMLGYINKGLLNTDLGKHVTMFGGIVDLRKNSLTYAFGGHFPMPVFSTPEGTRYLEGRGLPVGLFADAQYEDHSIQLPHKFSLTTFSDGILEVLPQKELRAKEAYLLELIEQAGGTCDLLRQRLKLDQLEDAPDDIAMLVLSRNIP